MRVLSLCTSAGLWDRAFIEAGHEVVPGCELMPHKRAMYEAFCGGSHLVHDIKHVASKVDGQHFDGIIGGIPCQSRTKLRAIREPKFGDLLPYVLAVLDNCTWDWALFENVTALEIPGFHKVRMNAMNYGQPHQSRERWFTYSPNLVPPKPLFPGDVDDLMAYSVVAGRIYGPKRGSKLQGWPEFMDLAGKFKCVQMQEALADGVPRGLADAWIGMIESATTQRRAVENWTYSDHLHLPPPGWRGGALAFRSEEGEWVVAHPGEPLFSTVTMSATHLWTGGAWKQIESQGEAA